MAVSAAAIGGVVLGGAEFFDSLSKEKKAKAEEAKLKQPFLQVQDEYFQNRNAAAGLASTGTPSDQKNAADIERRRGLGTGISALVSSGASPNDISSLLSVYGNSVNSSAAADAQTRVDNIRYFMGVNKDLAGQKTNSFVVNELQPYERKLKELKEREATAEANKWTGVKTALGSASSFGTGQSNASLLKKGTTGSRGGQSSLHDTIFGQDDPFSSNSGSARDMPAANNNPLNDLSPDQLDAIFNYFQKI